MDYEFKKLAEVESLSEVPENATVLAEVDGFVKRIPSSGLGGGSVSSWNDLEDKPFYQEINDIVILSETTLEGFAKGTGGYYTTIIASDLNITSDLQVGTKYSVIYDGVTYEDLECYANELQTTKYIGSGDELDGDYPFGIRYFQDEMESVYKFSFGVKDSTLTSHTFTIIEQNRVTKQLDEKFIPDSVKSQGGYDMIIEVPYFGGTSISGKFTSENIVVNDINNIMDLMKQGNPVNIIIKVTHAYSDFEYTHYILPSHILFQDGGANVSYLHIHWIYSINANDTLGFVCKMQWDGSAVIAVATEAIMIKTE